MDQTFQHAKLVDLPKIPDARGSLSFVQGGSQLPFEIERCYWIYDVPGGEERYGRALRSTSELIVALSGSFDVRLVDGLGREQTFSLNRGYKGVLVPPMHWRELVNFSTNSVAMVIASTVYSESDYIRSIDEFLESAKH